MMSMEMQKLIVTRFGIIIGGIIIAIDYGKAPLLWLLTALGIASLWQRIFSLESVDAPVQQPQNSSLAGKIVLTTGVLVIYGAGCMIHGLTSNKPDLSQIPALPAMALGAATGTAAVLFAFATHKLKANENGVIGKIMERYQLGSP